MFRLPKHRVFSNVFADRLPDNVILIESLPIKLGSRLSVTFVSTNSPWRQGIWLGTDGQMRVNNVDAPSMQLWTDSSPTTVTVDFDESATIVHLYNIWDRGMGRNSQAWTSGMICTPTDDGDEYHCNDIGFSTAFDKLVFRLKWIHPLVEQTQGTP